ncbi:VWA domain-containing protein [Candidatus Woesearchaeota archaeon]|nr:VWA domain-containing protein [Candidatus Woesearchaeota archaeon]
MAHDIDILARARALVGTNYNKTPAVGGTSAGVLDRARRITERSAEGTLDIYLAFDTTGSMGEYIEIVKDNIAKVTDAILGNGTRLSINGIGDHCDGEDWLQMYQLNSNSAEAKRALESIAMTGGGDEPEAYECLALALAQRLPAESAGRKKAVVLVADAYPHGMKDEPCERGVDYKTAFTAMKTVCDGFYLVGCNQNNYALQKKIIDSSKPESEKFIPLGSMVDVLPDLLVALAKKMESAASLGKYMELLRKSDAGKAEKIAGLLGKG